MSLHFLLDPGHDHVHKIVLLHLAQSSARLHFVPFSDAFPTAGGSCMLRYKDRMSTHGSLLSIIRYICRCFPLCDKIFCMFPDRIKPFFIYIINILLLQMKTASKSGITKSFKELSIPFVFCHKTSPLFRLHALLLHLSGNFCNYLSTSNNFIFPYVFNHSSVFEYPMLAFITKSCFSGILYIFKSFTFSFESIQNGLSTSENK